MNVYPFQPRVKILRDYPMESTSKPLTILFKQADTIRFTKARRASIPTVFYPNMNTGMDDQLSRCKNVKAGVLLEKRTKKAIVHTVQNVTDWFQNQ